VPLIFTLRLASFKGNRSSKRQISGEIDCYNRILVRCKAAQQTEANPVVLTTVLRRKFAGDDSDVTRKDCRGHTIPRAQPATGAYKAGQFVADIVGVLESSMVGYVTDVRRTLNGYPQFPEEGKVAIASMSYGGIHSGGLTAARAAIVAQDWATAAATCQVAGVHQDKNRDHTTLFENAAKVAQNLLQDVLPATTKKPIR